MVVHPRSARCGAVRQRPKPFIFVEDRTASELSGVPVRGIFPKKYPLYMQAALPRYLFPDLSRRRGCGGVTFRYPLFLKMLCTRKRRCPSVSASELSSVVTWGHVSGSQTAPTARRASYWLGVPSALVERVRRRDVKLSGSPGVSVSSVSGCRQRGSAGLPRMGSDFKKGVRGRMPPASELFGGSGIGSEAGRVLCAERIFSEKYPDQVPPAAVRGQIPTASGLHR